MQGCHVAAQEGSGGRRGQATKDDLHELNTAESGMSHPPTGSQLAIYGLTEPPPAATYPGTWRPLRSRLESRQTVQYEFQVRFPDHHIDIHIATGAWLKEGEPV